MPRPAEKPEPKAAAELRVLALAEIPLVQAGDDIADLVLHGLASSGLALRRSDVLVIAQKIVSKAEGRVVDLRDVTPSARATTLAAEVDKTRGSSN